MIFGEFYDKNMYVMRTSQDIQRIPPFHDLTLMKRIQVLSESAVIIYQKKS